MADNQLLQYIITQEHAGYSELQIRQALQQNGYDKNAIDDAFRQLKPRENDEVQGLVQQCASQGYPPVQVFTMLTQQGHHAGAVRKAINNVYGPIVMPRSHLVTAAFVIVALLIAGGGTYLVLQNDDLPVQPNYPLAEGQELSTTEQITRILGTAATDKSAAVSQCMTQFFNEDRGTCISAVATHPAVSDDRLCDQIVQAEVRDACLLNFLNEDFEGVCSRVQLRSSIELCESISKLRQVPPST